jgi:hypothetical protein
VYVMVNYIEPNLQEFIFRPIRVGLITQKQFWDHLKTIPGARPPATCYHHRRTPEQESREIPSQFGGP